MKKALKQWQQAHQDAIDQLSKLVSRLNETTHFHASTTPTTMATTNRLNVPTQLHLIRDIEALQATKASLESSLEIIVSSQQLQTSSSIPLDTMQWQQFQQQLTEQTCLEIQIINDVCQQVELWEELDASEVMTMLACLTYRVCLREGIFDAVNSLDWK